MRASFEHWKNEQVYFFNLNNFSDIHSESNEWINSIIAFQYHWIYYFIKHLFYSFCWIVQPNSEIIMYYYLKLKPPVFPPGEHYVLRINLEPNNVSPSHDMSVLLISLNILYNKKQKTDLSIWYMKGRFEYRRQ